MPYLDVRGGVAEGRHALGAHGRLLEVQVQRRVRVQVPAHSTWFKHVVSGARQKYGVKLLCQFVIDTNLNVI